MSSVQVVRGELVRGRGRAFSLIWWFYGILAGALALVLLGYGVLHPSDPPICLLNLALLAGPVYLLFRAAPRCWRAGVTVGEQETVVVNPLRTLTVPISEVERFEAGGQSYGWGNPTAGVVLVKRDGGRVPVWALASEGFVWNVKRDSTRWQPVAYQLNKLLPNAGGAEHAGDGGDARPTVPQVVAAS